ncbi:glutamate racemase [Eubacteriales bacterium OttesenSCG-928-K08]|nr:glutamate racemase [Eubacteriales bacterium OttesenSCG-928-K08]
MDNRPIGVFDSGLGGISTLRQAIKALPNESFLYYGDCINAPYGGKSEAELRVLTHAACAKLVDNGAKALLIACNTTVVAVGDELREAFDVPIVGIKPPVEFASKTPGEGLVLVMATQTTTRLLLERAKSEGRLWPERAVPIPCPGEMVARVERGMFERGDYDDLFHELFAPYAAKAVDAIVLGCTHYPFIQEEVFRYAKENFQGDPLFFDGGMFAVEELKNTLNSKGLQSETGVSSTTFMTSGDYERMKALFDLLLNVHVPMRGIAL